MGTDLAGVSPDEDLDLGWFIVTLDLDRRKTGSRFVFNGPPTALGLISVKKIIGKSFKFIFVDHVVTSPDVGSQVD